MPYPPEVPPATRTNATPQTDNHPDDHTLISVALTEILNHIAEMEVGAHVDGGVGRTISTALPVGSTVLHVPVSPVVDYQTRMYVTGAAWAGSDSSAIASVQASLNVQVAGSNWVSPTVVSAGASQWAVIPIAHSWLVPAGGSPQFGISMNWAGGFTGQTYMSADAIWHRYRA